MNRRNQKLDGGRLETYSEEQMLWHIEQAGKLSQEAQSEMGTMGLSPPPGNVEPEDIRNEKAALRRKLAVAIETLKAAAAEIERQQRIADDRETAETADESERGSSRARPPAKKPPKGKARKAPKAPATNKTQKTPKRKAGKGKKSTKRKKR